MREFVFAEEASLSLNRYLGRVLPELSKQQLRELLKKRDIKINGARVSKDTLLFCGDKVCVFVPEKKLGKISLDLIYKSKDIAVFCKPRGITNEEFAQRVASQYPAATVCHRLDTNTQGLLIFALNTKAEDLIKEAFKRDYIRKIYIARVVGRFACDGVQKGYLLKDGQKGIVKIYGSPVPDAVSIATGFNTVSYDAQSNTSLVSVELLTGKTHQIRAHLSYLGYPIVGDPKYGDFTYNRKAGKQKQQLSAYRLQFLFSLDSCLAYLNKQVIAIDADFI